MMTEIEKKTLETQMKETEERLKYQRALYRVHDCDDLDLKQYFQNVIKDYEKKHSKEVKKKSFQTKDFDGRGLA